jgi:hypothetical protein
MGMSVALDSPDLQDDFSAACPALEFLVVPKAGRHRSFTGAE